MRCWYCGEKMIWDSDFNYDEVYGEGEGIVTFLHCSNCDAECRFSLRDDESEETFIVEQTFSEHSKVWEGWYKLKGGNLLHCTEYQGSSPWSKEWEGYDPIPDGAVNYSIYNASKEEIDGGVMAYMYGEKFSKLIDFLIECNQGEIISRLSDSDIETLELSEI